MKLKYFMLFTVAALFTGTGCSDSFLEKEPIGRVGKDLLLRDMAGAKAALAGSYNRMAYYYTHEFTMYPDIASDDVKLRTTGSSADVGLALYPEHNFQSRAEDNAAAVGHIWLNIYEALNNINNLVNAIPTIKRNEPNFEAELEAIKGEALVLRALAHFDLARVYAQHYTFTADGSHLGVPVLLRTPGPNDQVARASMKATYAQIIKDLKEAIEILKNTPYYTQRVYASAQSARALLSRVYLYMEDWNAVVQYADEVINDQAFTLTPNDRYKDMFMSQTPGSEVIWQLHYRGNSSGTMAAIYSSPSYQAYASNSLWALYEDGDIRKEVYGADGNRHNSLKYNSGTVGGQSLILPKVIRLSEVLLNRAEAQWHLNQFPAAAADVDKIIKRANPTTTKDAMSMSPEQLLTTIKEERRKELAFEGHRLYDITRRKENLVRGDDCNSVVCTLTYPNVRFILPIPSLELDANKAMQPNPGIN